MKADQRAIESLIDELKITRLSTKELFESFDDADALLDRLLHQSYKIELNGESLRKTSRS
jgi:DNA replication protein DnaC